MVRIVLCTRNGAKYIRDQLDSILSQKTEEPFEIVVSDDASEDGTAEILEEYQAADPGHLRVVRRSKPSGSAWRNFMSALSELPDSEGDYIMLSDQDDYWMPSKISKELAAIRKRETELGEESICRIPLLVHCDCAVVDERLAAIAASFTAYQKMSPERRFFRQYLVQNNVVGGSVIFNGALLQLVKSVPLPEQMVMHDHWLALLASAFGEVRYLPEALYLYRQHTGNEVGAERGGTFSEILKRLGVGEAAGGRSREEMDRKSRKVYDDLFRQAREFQRLYGAVLPAERARELGAFLGIPERNRAGKIFRVLRYGFTYNLPHRTLGELLYI